MAKLLRPQDVLLLALAGAGDIFEEISDPLGVMASGCKNIYGWVPPKYRRHNFYALMSHSLKTGYIERIIKNGQPYLRLTAKGNDKVKRDFPYFFFQNKKWDGKWRVVIFDIEEVKRRVRDKLREKLRSLGFGMLQESVWVTPHDVAEDFSEFLEAQGLAAKALVLVVEKLFVGDNRELAERIWPIEEINQAYQKLIEDFTKKDKTSGKAKEEEQRAFRVKYLEILRIDPYLPSELLPKEWWGNKAKALVKNLRVS